MLSTLSKYTLDSCYYFTVILTNLNFFLTTGKSTVGFLECLIENVINYLILNFYSFFP